MALSALCGGVPGHLETGDDVEGVSPGVDCDPPSEIVAAESDGHPTIDRVDVRDCLLRSSDHHGSVFHFELETSVGFETDGFGFCRRSVSGAADPLLIDERVSH